jgi:hypothetical protein
MKSKTLRKGTRRRRLRRNVKKTKTKRGGMLRGALRSNLGTTIYHEFLPLFTKFNNHIIGQKLTPEQNALVQNGNRYFETFAHIPADDPLKASITELMKEWSSTEKNAEKTLGFYNKILQTLKDAEKKRKQQLAKDAASNRPSTGAFLSPLSASLASIAPMSLRQAPPGTPGKYYNPVTPQKVSGDEKGSRSVLTPSTGQSFAPTLHNPSAGKTVQHLSFGDERGPDTTPPASPDKFESPPRLPSKPRGPLSPLSPSRVRFRLG